MQSESQTHKESATNGPNCTCNDKEYLPGPEKGHCLQNAKNKKDSGKTKRLNDRHHQTRHHRRLCDVLVPRENTDYNESIGFLG